MVRLCHGKRQRKPQVCEEVTLQLPLFPAQIPYSLPWDLTQAFLVKAGVPLLQTAIEVTTHDCVIIQHGLQEILVPKHRVIHRTGS